MNILRNVFFLFAVKKYRKAFQSSVWLSYIKPQILGQIIVSNLTNVHKQAT